MFWKKNSKNLAELEDKLLTAETELSFLKAQTEKQLSQLFYKHSEIQDSLSVKFRAYQADILALNSESVWPISAEVKLIQDFIELYSSLSESEIHYKVDFDIEDPEEKIPALILLPIIQNCVISGYNSMENFPLKLRLKVKAQHLSLEISNRVNHYLVNQADDTRIKSLESRLFKEFGKEYSLFINSNSNLFKITLLLNLIEYSK
ncbi:sensor histidine kinase [Sphingobacterium cellulitidis]|uniref:sensor histidine kinase n=1 Tax=Sphingobacterium cellulitidis TaxID=1768011 RepID=UPI003C7EBC0E